MWRSLAKGAALSLRQRLSHQQGPFFAGYATLTAFLLYATMYGFRKPFTAATWEGMPPVFGLEFKNALVVFQIAGYALSKFIGIRVVSAAGPSHRARSIAGMITGSWLALLAFALVPPSVKPWILSLNGLALGMIWGLVFSYLEGRRLTEFLGLGLCASFVLSSAFVKDVGRSLLRAGVSEPWMPFATGAVFFLPMLLTCFALDLVPGPDPADEDQRLHRAPMTPVQRRRLFTSFAPGLVLLTAVYTLLSGFRTFRDDFMVEVWNDLRGPGHDVDFISTEAPVSIAVLLVLLPLGLIRSNRRALDVNFGVVGLGLVGCAISTLVFRSGGVSDWWWMAALGFFSYLAYIPFNAILFDRLIAVLRRPANVGFLIYLADSFGYLGSVAIVGLQNRLAVIAHADFLATTSLWQGGMGITMIALAGVYFSFRRSR